MHTAVYCRVLNTDVYKRQVLEQVSSFEYLGYSVSYNACNYVVNKLHKFNLMFETVKQTLESASKGTRPKFYNVMWPFPHFFMGLRLSLIHI